MSESDDDLPTGWEMVTMQDVATWGSGGTPSRRNAAYYGGKIPWIKTGELDAGVILDTEEKLTEEGLRNSSAKLFPKGSVAVAMYGATIGKVSILGISAATNQACAVGIPNERMASTKYLFHYLRSQKEAFIAAGKGGAQPNISQGVIKEWPFPLAPLSEQKRIEDKLETLLNRVDACRSRLHRLPDLLKRFRQSVLDVATSGKLTEEWREENKIVEAWREVVLADVADIQGGITKDSKKQDQNDEDLPYLRVANVQRGYLDLSEMRTIRIPTSRVESLLLKKGDILFNEGGDLDKLGRGWIWEGQIERCSYQNHVFRARLRDKTTEPKYISWWGNSRGLNYFLRSGKQTTNLASINKSMLSNLPISLPPSSEQKEIVRHVEELFAFADRIEASLAKARAQIDRLTPSVLAKAFRGELVPQEPNDEPASVLRERLRGSQVTTPVPRKQREFRMTGALKYLQSPKENAAMTKTRFDDDVKGKPYLAAFIGGPEYALTAEQLFRDSKLPLIDFYKQLSWEIEKGMIKDNGEKLEGV